MIDGELHRYTVDGIVYRDYRDMPGYNLYPPPCARCGHSERHTIPNGCEDWRCDCDAWYSQYPLFEHDPDKWRAAWKRIEEARAYLSAFNLKIAEKEYAANKEAREQAEAISVLPGAMVSAMRAMAKGPVLTRMLNIAAASRLANTSTPSATAPSAKPSIQTPTAPKLPTKTLLSKPSVTSSRKCPTCDRKAVFPNGWCGICKR